MLTLAAALLCGARWTTDSPSAVSGVYPGWRYLAWYGSGVYLIIATLLFIFYRPPATINHGNRSFMTRLLDFDKVGTLLWVVGIFGTILPLVWGGVSYDWTHVAVILPLVVGLVTLLIVLPVHQYRKKEGAFFNHVLFRNRNMAVRFRSRRSCSSLARARRHLHRGRRLHRLCVGALSVALT